eukprot:TRINITY_DN5593_c0_g2_i1.p1 TRINITY_DN5593_c0_g2~~TRINITY_DN5593_c0_g2_i1.p1  ORF type:complete len:503 (-),score=93.46 TRINITY_DN5593_c0_g2_i1:60-1448(-)
MLRQRASSSSSLRDSDGLELATTSAETQELMALDPLTGPGENGQYAKVYLRKCAAYGVVPEPAMIMVLRSASPVFKPQRKMSECDWLPIVETFLLMGKDCHVSRIYIANSKIGSNGCFLLQKYLEKTNTLTHLDVSSNRIGPRGIRALGEGLKTNKSITHLTLHGNHLFLTGAHTIAEVIDVNNTITHLDVSETDLGSKGVTVVRAAYNENKGKRMIDLDTDSNFVWEEIYNSVTHGLGAVMAFVGSIYMMIWAWWFSPSHYHVIGAGLFCFSLLFLYTASTLYHCFFKLRTVKAIFQRLDHSAIYVLIAGSYTPFLIVSVHSTLGMYLLAMQWCLCVVGVFWDFIFFDRFILVSLALYLAMGWVPAFMDSRMIYAIPFGGLQLMLIGGLLYSGGVVFFILGDRHHPVYHAVWHLFVLAASIAHYFAILLYILPQALPEYNGNVPVWDGDFEILEVLKGYRD